MDMSEHEVNYLAQAHWHRFRYRIGEMVGLDRERREVRVAPHVDDEDGRVITPSALVGYDTLVIAIGSLSNDFGTPGVERIHAIKLESRRPTRKDSTTHGQRLHPRERPADAAAAGATENGDHRRRRDRRRTRRGTASHRRARSSPMASIGWTPTRTSR